MQSQLLDLRTDTLSRFRAKTNYFQTSLMYFCASISTTTFDGAQTNIFFFLSFDEPTLIALERWYTILALVTVLPVPGGP